MILDGRKSHSLGSFELTDAQIEGKFHLLAEGLLSAADQKKFIDACWNQPIERVKDNDGVLPFGDACEETSKLE